MKIYTAGTSLDTALRAAAWAKLVVQPLYNQAVQVKKQAANLRCLLYLGVLAQRSRLVGGEGLRRPAQTLRIKDIEGVGRSVCSALPLELKVRNGGNLG